VKQYISNLVFELLYLCVGLFMLWAGVQVLGDESRVGIFMIACAGAMFTFTYVTLGALIIPIARWVRGNIKGQPFSFRERLR